MKFIAFLLILFSINTSYSQRVICSSKLINQNEIINSNTARKDIIESRGVIVVPVVFHVFYTDNDDFRISEDDILLQLDVLNNSFAGISYGLSSVTPEFRKLSQDSGIRFCLGYREVNSKVERGIEFKQTDIANFGDLLVDSDNKRRKIKYKIEDGADGWDSNIYINVWITSMANALGHSTFPIDETEEYKNEAGIIIDYHTLPNKYYGGKTLVHELGHYFDLRHIWGKKSESCQLDDGVVDTPIQYSPYFGCPKGDKYTCGSKDMYMNYMDYTNDKCSVLFTKGQIERMRNAIDIYRPTLKNNKNYCFIEEHQDNYLDKIVINAKGTKSISLYRLENIDKEININIFDISGRKIINDKLLKGQYAKYFFNSLSSSGIYIVVLNTNKYTSTRKIFVY